MRLTRFIVAAALTIGSGAVAGEVKPGDVKFGENGEVELSLTGVAGDAANGRKVFMNRKK